jgi:hypothetical protein
MNTDEMPRIGNDCVRSMLFDSPGRKARDPSSNRAIRETIPGLPAWAIKDAARDSNENPIEEAIMVPLRCPIRLNNSVCV